MIVDRRIRTAALFASLFVICLVSECESQKPPSSPTMNGSSMPNGASSCSCSASSSGGNSAGCLCFTLGQYDRDTEQFELGLASNVWSQSSPLKYLTIMSEGDVNGMTLTSAGGTYSIGFNSGFLTQYGINVPVTRLSGNFRVCSPSDASTRAIDNLNFNGYGSYGTNNACTTYQSLNIACSGNFQLYGADAVVSSSSTAHPYAFQFYFVGSSGTCSDSGSTFQNLFAGGKDSSDSSSFINTTSGRDALIVMLTIIPSLLLILGILLCYFRYFRKDRTTPRPRRFNFSSARAAAAASSITSDVSGMEGVLNLNANPNPAMLPPNPPVHHIDTPIRRTPQPTAPVASPEGKTNNATPATITSEGRKDTVAGADRDRDRLYPTVAVEMNRLSWTVPAASINSKLYDHDVDSEREGEVEGERDVAITIRSHG